MDGEIDAVQQEIASEEPVYSGDLIASAGHSTKAEANTAPVKFNTLQLVRIAVFVALAIVAKTFTVSFSPSMRVTLFYIPVYLSGAFFGPVAGFATGAIADLLGFFISPGAQTGPYNPITTIGNGISGMIFGLVFMFGKKDKSLLLLIAKVALGGVLALVIVTLGINTAGFVLIDVGFDKAFFAKYWARLVVGFPPRLIWQPVVVVANLILIVPIYIVLKRWRLVGD